MVFTRGMSDRDTVLERQSEIRAESIDAQMDHVKRPKKDKPDKPDKPDKEEK